MTCDTRVIDFDYALESSFSMTEKKHSLRNEKLKANRASETEEQRKEKLRIEEKIENHEKQRLATLKRLKRGEVEEKPKTGEGGR